MDEIKILLDMVSHLPSMALWVIAGLFAYKVVVIGSIFGVVRLAIIKTHDWLSRPRDATVNIRGVIDGMCITADGTHQALIAQLERIKGKGTGGGIYIHRQGVVWLREAIDDKEAKDLGVQAAKTNLKATAS